MAQNLTNLKLNQTKGQNIKKEAFIGYLVEFASHINKLSFSTIPNYLKLKECL